MCVLSAAESRAIVSGYQARNNDVKVDTRYQVAMCSVPIEGLWIWVQKVGQAELDWTNWYVIFQLF